MDLLENLRWLLPVNVSSLMKDKPYLIEHVEEIQTRYGEAVLLTLRESPLSFVKIFLPKRYGVLFTEANLVSINEGVFHFLSDIRALTLIRIVIFWNLCKVG
jgi:hypothetical protein